MLSLIYRSLCTVAIRGTGISTSTIASALGLSRTATIRRDRFNERLRSRRGIWICSVAGCGRAGVLVVLGIVVGVVGVVGDGRAWTVPDRTVLICTIPIHDSSAT